MLENHTENNRGFPPCFPARKKKTTFLNIYGLCATRSALCTEQQFLEGKKINLICCLNDNCFWSIEDKRKSSSSDLEPKLTLSKSKTQFLLLLFEGYPTEKGAKNSLEFGPPPLKGLTV